MSDTEALKNVPQSEPAAEFERTLTALQREFHSEIHKAQQLKSSQQEAFTDREKAVQDHLARAGEFYKKKEWARAFEEWAQVCAFLNEGDEFRRKVAALKESHENLVKVNRELAEIKGILNQRSEPSAADRKFVQDAHEEVSGQIKNVYAYLSQQLRSDRTPKTLSFWWPVMGALLMLTTGGVGLATYHLKAKADMKKQAERTGQTARLELLTLQSERDELAKKVSTQRQEYQSRIEELKSQNAGWRNVGREKVEELEVRLQEAEKKNEELTEKIDKLLQENLSLSSH